MSLMSVCQAETVFRADKSSLANLLETLGESEKGIISTFLKNEHLNVFTRPLYIGISNNLNQRVFKDHYKELEAHFEESSPVSRFLLSYPDATVQEIMDSLNLKHSFALEARARGINILDLVVYVHEMPETLMDGEDDVETNGGSLRRSVECILQLLTDPICGRR